MISLSRSSMHVLNVSTHSHYRAAFFVTHTHASIVFSETAVTMCSCPPLIGFFSFFCCQFFSFGHTSKHARLLGGMRTLAELFVKHLRLCRRDECIILCSEVEEYRVNETYTLLLLVTTSRERMERTVGTARYFS